MEAKVVMELDNTRWIGKKGTNAEGITMDLFEKMPFVYEVKALNTIRGERYNFLVQYVNVSALTAKFNQVCMETGELL